MLVSNIKPIIFWLLIIDFLITMIIMSLLNF